MVHKPGSIVVEKPRRPARDLIVAVLEHMRRNLEPLHYSTLVPSRYVVYLHPAEYARLEGILPVLCAQTERALGEEVERLNRPTMIGRYAARLGRRRSPALEGADGSWHVEVLPDSDGDLQEGDILVDSELLLPGRPELGAGERTRRLAPTHAAGQTTTTHRSEARLPPAAPAAFARIAYEDDSGKRQVDLIKDSVTIGRGGVAYPVDIRIVSSVDVSREHARIRRDPATGRCFLIDLSSLGTTLDGRHVPRGYDEVDGSKKENGVETALPDRARIGLAETVYLEFSLERS